MSAKKNSERSEDLNPRSDDLEARVKRMLDPSIPDEPQPPGEGKEPAAIKSVSTPTNSADTAPSAPELPTAVKAPSKGSKKVIIPIAHEDDQSQEPVAKQISITEHEGGTEAVAEKLDAAIAGLDTDNPDKPSEAPKTEPQAEAEDETPEAPLHDLAAVSSPETDKAVSDIVAAEGDELLEVEDAVRDTDQPVKAVKKPRRSLLTILKSWWAKPGFRKSLAVFAILLIVTLGVVPHTRYFVLNSVGVRASSSVLVLDQSTQQPLKNVNVRIGSVTAKTDEEGNVSLKKLKLGTSELTIEKRAFAPITKSITVGLGSNPLGDYQLAPTGSQYKFMVTDFLSGKPISKVEASSGEASAVSDDEGVIKLTVERLDDAEFTVALQAEGMRAEQVNLNPDDYAVRELKLVPARKQVFVSKRSGKYDVFSIHIDGKGESLVLAGSGHEKEGMVLVPHPNDEVVAYVSTRAGQTNSDGFMLSNLILLNLEDNSTTNIGASERIQVIDWSGSRLLYVQVVAGSSGDSPGRYKLMSYNYQDGSSKELASSNFFNDVNAVNGVVYYAPSSAYQTGKTGFFRINADGTDKQTVFDQEVWNIFRTAYDHFALSVEELWYDYHLGDKAPVKLPNAPASQISRIYINSPDAKHSIWADQRDGKGALLSYDTASQKDATLKSQSGLGYPMRWLNSTSLVYRVQTDQETADYAISIDGGEPVKIKDVTNSGGIDRWYHY